MWVVLFRVDMKSEWEGDREAELDMVSKATAETPGFVRGMWADDGAQGISTVVVESEEVAREMAGRVSIPPEAGVTLRSVEVFQVSREA